MINWRKKVEDHLVDEIEAEIRSEKYMAMFSASCFWMTIICFIIGYLR